MNQKSEIIEIKDIRFLRQSPNFIDQYIELRNKYADLLLTKQVSPTETTSWLKTANIETVLAVDTGNNCLLGIVIIYMDKSNEVTIFTRHPGSGLGRLLLEEAKRISKIRGLKELWSKVLNSNSSAKRLFINAGFKEINTEESNKELIKFKFLFDEE